MNSPSFSEMTAKDYLIRYGLKNAVANFTPYYRGALLYIVPSDILPELGKLVRSIETVLNHGGYNKANEYLNSKFVGDIKDPHEMSYYLGLSLSLHVYKGVYGEKEI